MGFELPNGKTARNLQEQVKFLTEKVKELIARVNELELHIEIVDELPETGSSDVIYFVPVEDPEEGNYYNEYMWIDDAWELIGTTQIDLSDYAQLSADNTFTGDNKFTTDVEAPALVHNSGALWLGAASGVQVGSHLFPGAVGTLNLGHSYYTWKDLYLSGKVIIYGTGGREYHIHSSNGYYLDIEYINNGSSEGSAFNVQYGSIVNTKKLMPMDHNTYDIGDAGTRYKDLYLSGNVYLGTSTTTYINTDAYNGIGFQINNNTKLLVREATTYVNNNLCPLTDNQRDLGAPGGALFRNLYLGGILSDGTNTVSVAQIASGIGGTYRHVIYIEGATADINIAVNLNSATAITTQAALAAINNNVMGGTATLDVQDRYTIVAIDSVGTVGSIVYLDDTGQHTLNIVDIYQDVVNQI